MNKQVIITRGSCQIGTHVPQSKIELDIFKSIGMIFEEPNSSELFFREGDSHYFITVYTDYEVSWQDLKKLEQISGCQVKIKHGLYGFAMFFTPKSAIKPSEINPSER
jgi:hypothetical protein